MSKNTVITIGTFDGVHLGHKYLLNNLVSFAKNHNKKTVLITYNRHPLETLYKDVYPYLLTEKSKKIDLLQKIGIDDIFFIDFDDKFAAISPETFLEEKIIYPYKPFAVFSGYDTHFGKNRKGNFDLLKEYSKKFEFQLIKSEPFTLQNDLIVSSSMIRDVLRKGLVDTANSYLGYPYSIIGTVVSGKQIGRNLGFPTVNISPIDNMKLIPDAGVYVTLCKIDDKLYNSVTNIGTCPTVKNEMITTIEAHILDLNADLYNKYIELIILSRIRGEIKFNSKLELIKKIENDITYTRNYLYNYSLNKGSIYD